MIKKWHNQKEIPTTKTEMGKKLSYQNSTKNIKTYERCKKQTNTHTHTHTHTHTQIQTQYIKQ